VPRCLYFHGIVWSCDLSDHDQIEMFVCVAMFARELCVCFALVNCRRLDIKDLSLST